MRMALKKAGLKPSDIDYINAHGTSTHGRTRLELGGGQARCSATTSHGASMSSTKSAIGHLLGGAGAVEASSASSPSATRSSRRRSTSTIRTRAREGVDLVPHKAKKRRGARGAQQQLRLRRHQRLADHEGGVRRLLVGAPALVARRAAWSFTCCGGAGAEPRPAHRHRRGGRDRRLGRRASLKSKARSRGLHAPIDAMARLFGSHDPIQAGRVRDPAGAWAARRSSTCCSTASRCSG